MSSIQLVFAFQVVHTSMVVITMTMLSKMYGPSVAILRSKVLQPLYKGYTTAINIKSQPNIKSYVETNAREWQNAKSFKKLPGMTKFQWMRAFMKGGEFADSSLNDLMLTCRKRFGDIFVLPGIFGLRPLLVLFDVKDFEKVHRTEGVWPVRPGQESMIFYRENRSDGYFAEWQGLTGNGEQWGKFRTAVNPVLMQPRNAKLYLEPMQHVNDDFIQRIREIRDPVTMEVPGTFLDNINHLTFESVAVVALDKRLGLIHQTNDMKETLILFESIQVLLKSLYDLGIKPNIYKFIKTPTYRRFEKAMDTIFDITSRYVNESLERIKNQGENAGGSVLEKLVKIDQKIATVMAMDMMMAGVDTTTSVMSGLFLCLAKNPEKQEKLRKEILSIVPNKEDKFTIENMKEMPYLRACIKESLRIYPIIFGNMREAGMDIVLNGYQIPKGTAIIMNSNLLLSEERYFPRAKEFLPERWLRDEKAYDGKLMAEGLNPFIFLPFGFGPRSCVGKRIVELEIELTASNLVRNFDIEFNYPTENAFKNYMMNTPAIPLKFKFTDRHY